MNTNIKFLLGLLGYLPFSAIALYNGNPSLPMMPEHGAFISKEDWYGLKIGYLFDDVYDRKVNLAGQHMGDAHKKVRKYKALSNFGVITFNGNDRIEIFGLLGTMSSHLTQVPFKDTTITYHIKPQFTWGVGGRAIIAYWGELQFAANAAYLKSDPHLSSVKVNGISYSTKHSQIDYTQWQIGLGFSYRLHAFIPYFGVDYSDFREKYKHLDALKFVIPSKQTTFKNSYMFGLFFGLGFVVNAFQVNFETRCINENGVSAHADFKF